MRILIAQATRMGDVIQTSPLIRMVRAAHPEAHIAALVRRMGRAAAERHPDVDAVIEYEEDTIFQHLLSGDSDRLLEAYRAADAYIETLRQGRYDRAYNLTHSLASAMLLKLAGIPEVVGAHLSDDWQYVLRGPWTTYFYTSVFHREYNDLNLCDITRNFAAGAPPCRELVFALTEADRAAAAAIRARAGIGPDDFTVCFQLGASEENKRWAPEHFARLGTMLRERHGARILLLGIAEEAPLGEAFAAAAPGLATPLYGETSIAEAAALLEGARLLVTNDTGTMHIAAAMGCPITLVSVGNVHYRETGPYGVGHVAIERRREALGGGHHVPGGLEERQSVLPEQVFAAVELTLAAHAGAPRGGPVPLPAPLPESPALANVDLYMTAFAPDGCLAYYPLLRRAMNERDLLRMAYRAMWLEALDPEYSAGAEAASIAQQLERFDGPEIETVRAWAERHGARFTELAALAEQGISRTGELLAALGAGRRMAEARTMVQDLMRLDEEARLFSEMHPPCKPLTLIARYERDNLEGADPAALAETTRAIYAACRSRALGVAAKLRAIGGQGGLGG